MLNIFWRLFFKVKGMCFQILNKILHFFVSLGILENEIFAVRTKRVRLSDVADLLELN